MAGGPNPGALSRAYDRFAVAAPPERADVIFVLAGRYGRKSYGVKLWRDGWAGTLLLSVDIGNTPFFDAQVAGAIGPVTNVALVGLVLLAPWLGVFSVWLSLANLGVGVLNLLLLPGSDGKRAFALPGISSFADLWKNLWNGSEWADVAVRK